MTQDPRDERGADRRRLWWPIPTAARGLVVGLIASVALCATAIGVLPRMSTAAASSPYGQTLIQGSAWLNGLGVDVYSNGTSSNVSGDYSSPAVGMKWQCVELAQRLYTARGWHRGLFPAVGTAADIWTQAPSMGMVQHPNGSGYIPVPGDMVVLQAQSGVPYGHVSIVDAVFSDHVTAVEQNWGSPQTGRASYGLSGSTLSRASLALFGTVHSPANGQATPHPGPAPAPPQPPAPPAPPTVAPPSKHNVNLFVHGPGSASSSPGGLSCGHEAGCSLSFDTSTQLTLTASPDSGASFTGWSQDCSGSGSTCSLSMTADHNVQATFAGAPSAPAPGSRHNINLYVHGPGSVSSSPGGLFCGHDAGCSLQFDGSTQVTLTASPDPGVSFTGWAQDCAGGNLSCSLSMGSDHSVQATFAAPTAASGPPAPGQTPHMVGESTYTEGALVYVRLDYVDPSNVAVGFGFAGVNGSGWAPETHLFSSPSYGRVSPGRVDYPFNLGCGTSSAYHSQVQVWVYDNTGAQSAPAVVALACASSGVPTSPSNVTATPVDQYHIRVDWHDNSSNEDSFKIDNGCPSGYTGCAPGATLEGSAGPNVTSLALVTTPGAYQCFRVQAVNASGASAWSGYGCATTPGLSIPAGQAWTDTGVDLVPGTKLAITASGTIKIASSDPGKNPQGDAACAAGATFVAPGLPCWSLIGRIDNGPAFEVGPTFHAACAGGRLYLGVNDDQQSFFDNSGAWQVNIKKG